MSDLEERPKAKALEKALRSAAVEERCAAVVSFVSLLTEDATPVFINNVFLRLGDLFRADDTNKVRIWVLWLFLACSHLLPVVRGKAELLRRIAHVLTSNDPLARTLAWRTIGAMAVIIPEIDMEVDLPTKASKVLASSQSPEEECEAVLYTMTEISKVSGKEFNSLIPQCLERLQDIATDPALKVKCLRWLQECDSTQLATPSAVEGLVHSMASYPTISLVCPFIDLLSHLAVHCMDHNLRLQLIDTLLHFIEKDPRPAVQVAALHGILQIAHTPLLRALPWLWLSILQTVLKRLTDSSNGTVQFLSLHVMLCSTAIVVPCLMESRETARTIEDLLAACKAFLWHPMPPLVLGAAHTLLSYLQHRQGIQGPQPKHAHDILDLCHASTFAALRRQGTGTPCTCVNGAPGTFEGDRRCQSHAFFKRLLGVLMRLVRLEPSEGGTVHSHLLQLVPSAGCKVRQKMVLHSLRHVYQNLAPQLGASLGDPVKQGMMQRVLSSLQSTTDDATWQAGWRFLLSIYPKSDHLPGVITTRDDSSLVPNEGELPSCEQQAAAAIHRLLDRKQWWLVYVATQEALKSGAYQLAALALAPLMNTVEDEEVHLWLQVLSLLCRCQGASISSEDSKLYGCPVPLSFALKLLSDATVKLHALAALRGSGCCLFQTMFLSLLKKTLHASSTLRIALAEAEEGSLCQMSLKPAANAFGAAAEEWQRLSQMFIDMDEGTVQRLKSGHHLCATLQQVAQSQVPLTSTFDVSLHESLLPSLTGRSHTVSDVLGLVSQKFPPLSHGIPPYFFCLYPNTSVQLTLLPAGSPLQVDVREAVVFHIEGAVRHRHPAVRRPPRGVSVEFSLTQDLHSIDTSVENGAADRCQRLHQELRLTEGFFTTDFVVQFPLAGSYCVALAVRLSDESEATWDVHGGRLTDIMVTAVAL